MDLPDAPVSCIAARMLTVVMLLAGAFSPTGAGQPPADLAQELSPAQTKTAKSALQGIVSRVDMQGQSTPLPGISMKLRHNSRRTQPLSEPPMLKAIFNLRTGGRRLLDRSEFRRLSSF
ncbi:MAG TPA: hypothetical protein VG672_11755 [Bryobacteraceae bacterium]|nr:hypothetical protein [Bryobacteraceae bacterium]